MEEEGRQKLEAVVAPEILRSCTRHTAPVVAEDRTVDAVAVRTGMVHLADTLSRIVQGVVSAQEQTEEAG